MWKVFLFIKKEPSDSNSNTINTTPTVSFSSNTPVCGNNDDVSIQSEGIDSLGQFFETQLQNLMQISPVKSNSKGTNTNKSINLTSEVDKLSTRSF